MLYNYELRMKQVIDALETMNDAMDSLKFAIIQYVLGNTASMKQVIQIPVWVTSMIEKAANAETIVIVCGDVETRFEGLHFSKDNFSNVIELFNTMVKLNCWYEDRLPEGTGFCWHNGEELCSLIIE